MQPFTRILCALVLAFVCLPLLANDCPAIQSLTVADGQTGGPIVVRWSYSGGQPLTQSITGKDFDEPVVLGAGATQYVYRAAMPGEKHLQLTAVTECGTVTREVKYHVKQCNVVAPPLTTSATRVVAGSTFTASVALEPGHTAEWEIVNGTASATTGASVEITAGTAGSVQVRAWISRGNSCSVRVNATVRIDPPCSIAEPPIYAFPEMPTGNTYFSIYTELLPGQNVTYAVRGAEVMFMGGPYVDLITPASGTFEVDVIVSNATCTRTFTRSFAVSACEATAAVSAGNVDPSCGPTSVVAEFGGIGPWYGSWSDGEWFYTETPRIEREVTNAGTYTIGWFYDQRSCPGVVTGSVDVAGRLPRPHYVIEPIPAEEWWSEMGMCLGSTRTAQLTTEVPAGAQLVWSIDGGTIVSGQGTPRVEFLSSVEGLTNLTATVVSSTGCATSYADEYFRTMDVPRASLTVEPSTIGLGGTAVITVHRDNLHVGGANITSSLGDRIIPLGDNRYEYISTNGGGVATITLTTLSPCGNSTATTTLTIDAGNPVAGTASVRAIGDGCDDYRAFAELTGVAPFSGTWSNGTTFVAHEPYTFLQPPTGGTYTLVDFNDANGPGTITGSATFDFTGVPQPEVVLSSDSACLDSVITATITTPIPVGATPQWSAWNAEIVSGQGTSAVQLRITGASFPYVQVQFVGEGICSPTTLKSIQIVSSTPQQPQFDFSFPIEAGTWMEFGVYLDPNTATWAYENSLGDPMELVYSSGSFHILRYTSTHGAGTSNVRIYGTNACGGPFEATRTLEILPPPPMATMTSTALENCGAEITVTFSGGLPPFRATWAETGETITTNDFTYTRRVTGPARWISIYDISDSTRTGYYGASVWMQPGIPPYAGVNLITDICLGQPRTFTGPAVPEGWQLIWVIEGTNAQIVSGQGTSEVVIEGTAEGQFTLMNFFRTPDGCDGSASGGTVNVGTSCPTP